MEITRFRQGRVAPRTTILLCLLLGCAGTSLSPLDAQSALFSRPEAEAAPAKVPAGDLQPVSDRTFEDSLTVIEVEVPVQVLVGGKPVTGLQASDFEILDRGESREIIAFDVIDLSRSTLPSEVVPGDGLEVDRESPPPASRRQFLALFDLALSRRPFLARSLDSVRVMVHEQLHPSDRVGVAVLGRDGAQLMLGLTEDRARIDLALDLVKAQIAADRKGAQEAVAALAEYNEQTLLELTESVGPAAALALGDPVDRTSAPLPTPGTDFTMLEALAADTPAIAEALDFLEIGNTLSKSAVLSQVRRLNQSLSDLATLLRDIDGQKYFLYFSDGLQDFEELNQSGRSIRQASWAVGAGISKTFAEMVEAFRRAGWTINGFSIGGLSKLGSGALFYVAEETGGKLYENYNRLEVATQRMVESTSVTYNLVFQVADLPRDGRYHPIKVRLVDPPRKAQVRAREGYYAPKPEKQLSKLERELADTEALFSAPDRFEIPGEMVVVATPADGDRWRVSLVVGVDPSGLLEEQMLRRLVFDVQAYIGQPGRRGPVVSDIFADKLRIDLRRDDRALREGGLSYLADFEVGPGEWEVRVRLRDRRSGRELLSTNRFELETPTGTTFLEPLLLQSKEERVVAREKGSAVERSPFAVGDGVFLPQVPPHYSAGTNVPLLVQGWGEGVEGCSLSVELIDPSGRALEGERLRNLERVPRAATGEERTVLFAHVDTAGLEPGPYRVELTWTRGDKVEWSGTSTFNLVR